MLIDNLLGYNRSGQLGNSQQMVEKVRPVLAKRMQKILLKIISMDQQGYLKNRNICFNIRQIQDVIDYAEYFQIEALILF